MPGSNFFSKASDTLQIALTDESGLAVLARCLGAAPTTANVFQHGCIIIRVDSGTGVAALYQNTGSSAVPSWTLMDVAGAIPGLPSAQLFVGNAGGVATATAITGDVTISNTGVTSIAALSVVDADVSATAAIAFSKLAALTSTNILVGSAGNVPTSVAVTGDVTISNTGVTAIGTEVIVNADVNPTAGIAFSKLAALTAGNVLLGGIGDIPSSVTLSGAISVSALGLVSLGAGVVTNANVADSNGTGALGVPKSAIVVYDFAVDGGAIGPIALTGSPSIPDNAVVHVDSYEVASTLTSATDAATVTLGFPTDGDLFTAIDIAAGTNPWDAGVFVGGMGAMVAPAPKKLTGARTFQLSAAVEAITAGRIIFHVSYWVSA